MSIDAPTCPCGEYLFLEEKDGVLMCEDCRGWYCPACHDNPPAGTTCDNCDTKGPVA